ncbi:centromere protein N [Corythoichthys intestinalis]|uniref:centromere protein N n=1 Tax=Corythoichthys intestinalis TaxID=161448 RepID=UPI0025A68772|nr:centromere protein N [Corythoichthys intestinalis]XP_061796435.1 centromere protein N-like [Nerophis lumbriciformis]
MRDQVECLLRRLVRRIPTEVLKVTLEKWGRLTVAQQQNIDFKQTKWALADEFIALSEENGWTIRQIAELEMIYVIDNPDQGMWHAFQLVDPDTDASSVGLIQFKEKFKSNLSYLVRHVSIKMKKNTDEAIWIRIAWGDSYSRPNNMIPTYVVHYLQTPYVFVTRMTSKQKPLLSQALIIATRHQGIKDAKLSGRKLSAIRDLLMQQYDQVFPAKYPIPLQERSQIALHPHLHREHAKVEENRHQLAYEAFGGGKLPQLQSVVYKLDTKFKDPTNQAMMEREKPFKCVVTFASTNLLESLRHCASSGIASTPVTPLLSSIPRKGRNYFVITDRVQAPSTKMNQPTNPSVS